MRKYPYCTWHTFHDGAKMRLVTRVQLSHAKFIDHPLSLREIGGLLSTLAVYLTWLWRGKDDREHG
jgi:hypothetical protein